jgi:hypothetical protein
MALKLIPLAYERTPGAAAQYDLAAAGVCVRASIGGVGQVPIAVHRRSALVGEMRFPSQSGWAMTFARAVANIV